MRITKKIISLLLVLSMLASFVAMSGFEAGALAVGTQKTDFGLHFDDTTRKYKILQLSDIQTDVDNSNISDKTKQTIKMAIEQYDPDMILLTGDQTMGDAYWYTIDKEGAWKDTFDKVYSTFAQYIDDDVALVAVPGNHEYDFGSMSMQYEYYMSKGFEDWDNNFGSVDMEGAPGAGNVTISASSGNKAVALNLALFNSLDDDGNGNYLRPGGTDDAKYMEIVNWYKNMNEAIASSTYSYKAQKTGASKAYVPTFGAQHIILQEIYTEGAILGCDSTEPGAVPPGIDGDYSSLNPGPYYKLNPDRPHGGVMGEAPCGSGYSTRALYDALLEDGNFLGMTFGHDHLNSFDIVDDNGFHYYYGGALGLESYNNGNPTFRFFEFTLDDTTGEVSVASESNSYDNMTVNYANVDEERIEAINASGVQLPHTISVPRIIYVGGSINNETNIKNSQELGNTVQSALLDYQTKEGYTHDRTVNVCVPEDSAFTHPQYLEVTCNGNAVAISDIRTDNSHTGLTVYSFDILTSNSLPLNKNIEYTVRYTAPNGKDYEIHSASYVESIKQPAGYYDWMRSWRNDNSVIESNGASKSSNWIDAAVVQTLSGPNVFATANETSPEQNGGWSPNIYYKYDGATGEDVDNNVVNKNGASDNTRYPMMFSSPSKDKGQDGLLRPHSINRPATNKLYIDVSTLKPVSDSDSRLDLGARIDFWLAKDTDNGFPAHAAGIGFYEGSHTYSSGAATINPNDNYTYTSLAQAELGSNAGVDGTKDECSIFLYDGYANQQSVNGIGSTHVNHNTDSSTRIGTFRGHTAGWPLVADSVDAIKAMDGKTITMFTGVRVKGHNSINRQHMLTIISPYHINFYVHDKTALRDLVMQELMNPRIRSDYPHAAEGAEKAQLWTDYIEAYNLALSYYARTDIESQKVVDDHNTALVNAIAALLRSNMQEDESVMLTGKAPVEAVSVPPILYVSGSTIQTADPFTDTGITISGLPAGTSKVVIQAITPNADGTVNLDANGKEVTNTNIKFNGKTTNAAGSVELNINSDDTATGSIAGGTATAGDYNASTLNDGYVYYKITYVVNNVEYQTFAASYVRAIPYYQGRWIMKNVREWYDAGKVRTYRNSVYYQSHIDSRSAFAVRGASVTVALYPVQSATSFDASVLTPTSNNLNLQDSSYSGTVGWSIGTGIYKDYDGNKSGYRADGWVTFYNDRSRKNEEYWIGLSNGGGSSNEYIVNHFYFDPDAISSGTKLQTTITHYWDGSSGDKNDRSDHDGRQLWTLGTIGANYSGWPGRSNGQSTIETDTANVLQYVGTSTLDNNLSSSTTSGSIKGTIQNKINLTDITRGGSVQAAGYHQRFNEQRDKYCSVSTGVAFKYNSVDRSKAHAVINESIAAGYNQADYKPEAWAKYRQELLEAYVCCGNLWGSDFDRAQYDTFVDDPGKYREADYKVLTDAINDILTQLDDKGAATVKLSAGSAESILDYATVLYNVHNNDDSRYHGQKYNRTMFVKSAADLANLIKGRTEVYDAICTTGATPSDEGNNLHLAHLDFRYQKYITDYANAITAEWAKLRLLPADYTSLNKYIDYCDVDRNSIYFYRDDNAGYNNDLQLRNDANEKNLPFGVFTTKSWKALVAATDLPDDQLNLKKPSEQAAIPAADGSGTMPQIYPNDYQFTTKYPTDTANNDVCLYNTARDAYEDLKFRRAAEYYTTDGTYTEDGVTYYANYNITQTASKYIYTPIFSTNEANWPADVVNRGYAVVDKAGNVLKLYETYHAGNARDVDVTNGAGEVVSQVSPWTQASWGDTGYGFQDAYEDAYGTNSHYDQTNDSADKYEYALYVESKILPEIAMADYYFDNLVASTADYSQFNNEKTTYAFYEKFGGGYDALASYKIYDENGNVLTDGAQWYTADTWAAYMEAKNAVPGVIDGASLAENQNIINQYTQAIYQERAKLQLRPMSDFRVDASSALLGKTDFESINTEAENLYNEINNKKVKVFSLRADDPVSYAAVAGNDPLFIDHPYYTAEYITTLYGLYDNDSGTGVVDFGADDKYLATSIDAYIKAVNTFKAKYDENTDPQYVNRANTATLELLLNKTWIPEYDKYGAGNYNNGKWLLGDSFDGSDWYSNWDQYDTARKNALKFFNATEFDGEKVVVNLTHYGNQVPAGDFYVDVQGAQFAVDKDPDSPTYRQPIAVDGTSLEGTVNKAAYDLVVAYYSLQHKKVSDYNGTIAGITGTYDSINDQLRAMIAEKENEVVDVVIINAAGQLETVQRSVYDPDAIDEAKAYAETIAGLANDNLGDKYTEYVDAITQYKSIIDSLTSAPIYLDGWNGIISHLNENAGDTVTISDSGTMTSYFNAVYTGFNPATIYATGTDAQSINTIFSTKAQYDRFNLTAKQGQVDYNILVTNLYNELNAASFVPAQVTMAAMNATTKLSQSAKAAYDPLQLNGRDKVTNTNKYSADSVAAATNVVTTAAANKITLWNTDPTVTGYNDGAGTVVDGTIADEIWAAVGLVSDSGAKDYDGADRDERYLLVEGGQFLAALNDAVEYAKGELYEADGVTVKQFEIVAGNGTVTKDSIFTDESVKELTDALAAAVVTDTTTQAEIDQWVFDIIENTDIENTIFLLTEEGEFGVSLNNKAKDEGLKYKPANYSYLDAELGTAFSGESEGANALINEVWIDKEGDGIFELNNTLGSQYFTEGTWTPYYNNYINATNPNIISRDLTAKDQDKINGYTTSVYETRNALEWEGIDDDTWSQITTIENKIGNLENATFTVLTFTNSKVQVDENGVRILTAPEIGRKNLSAYGDVSHILSLWATFRANYLEAEGIDITKRAEMLEKLKEISDILDSLETKRFDTDNNNGFTEGARNLVADFIAGSYTFHGFSSGDSIGTYVADYQTVAEGTNINTTEQLIRNEQRIFIQNKLNALYTIIGSGMEVGDVYIDASGKRYETAIAAVNSIAVELYAYLTGQAINEADIGENVGDYDYSTVRAQYAGFGLDMRQAMYDYLSTEIVVSVNYRYAASPTVYTKSVPMFNPEMVEGIKAQIDGSGVDGNYGIFGTPSSWPTINLLNNGVGIELNENVQYDQTIYKMPVEYIEETGETIYQDVYVGSDIIGPLSGYSPFYSSSIDGGNMHHVEALGWLMSQAVVDTGDGIYILADTNGTKEIDSAVFHYSMEIDSRKKDGEWYTKDYGTDINQDGTKYYLAAHPTNKVTGSEYGGWFTDVTYEAVVDSRNKAIPYIEKYSSCPFGKGTAASQFIENLNRENATGMICWNKSNRDAYIANVKADQKSVDDVAGSIYGSICELKLLPATDAYRYVAGLIYDALGLIPTYSADNTTGIIIPQEEGNGVGELNANEELGGRLFNLDLLEYLAQYTTAEDEEGNTLYYSTQLPGSYNGGEAAVEAILALLEGEIEKGIVSIDKADALVLADTNSIKARIVTELEKLTLGLADLSKITSLTKAFLFNNPANAESLGSYDIDDNGVGEQFFDTTHSGLASGGNAKNYRGNEIMAKATGIYHASGFYDFSKYTEDSLREVISFLKNNDIITATLQATANNFNIENKTGFNIAFDPKTQGGELYNTPATQQNIVDAIYEELVAVINAMELQSADTETLKAEIASGDNVMLNEDIYDHEAVDNAGDNIWDEFVAALENANNYKDVTIINQNQVLEAEDRLEKAIKALVLYVDTFAPVVTIHNTQSDLSKFYADHESELKNTIASADKMVTASYMEPGLGGYTLYVYTNQLNPHIVVSLKDTTNVLNGDGSARTVTASKPEKMSVSAQAMNGVSANVITPVLDAKTGMPLSSVSTKLTGATTMTAQTAKNAEGTYDAESSAYIILNPQFSDSDGVQQAAAYTISATDSAVTKDAESGEIFDSVNGVETFKYANDTELIETTEDGKITVFVYYMNSMPADGDDSGFAADGTVNGSAILTYAEKKGLAENEWNGAYGLLRTFNGAVRNWEFSDINEDLNKGAVYVDPTFGENNFGSFIYKLDPTATEGLDYDIANIYFKDGADAAKAAFINALKSNVDYIAAFDAESKKADSTKYIPFGANENWDQHLVFIDNGTLLFAHVADRFGNVCNRIIEVKNYDQLAPQVTAEGAGTVNVVEPGGSGVAKVDLFNYMGTQGSSLYIDYLFNMLHIDDFTYVSEDNTFTIKAGAAAAGKLFTVAVTDKAGNVGSVPVNADENGDIVISVVETFDNVAEYAANDTKVDVNAGEDLEVIEFTFNSTETIKLNYIEPSSIVKAGPDGNVFADKKNVPLNITTKSEVEAVKLYNVAAGTEEIWTADNATVKDNGNGTKTWTVKYKFTEGEHNYIATAKVDGDWETFGVDFSFTATTKKVTVRLTVAGIGNIGFSYNEGNYSEVPVMSQKTVPYGSVVTLQALQTEEGSDFYYWINNGSNRIISAAETYEFTAVTNMDLTTQFTTNECFDNDKRLVVYVNNAENVIENFELAEGEDYKVPAAPSLPDHVFKSWSMTKDEILASDEMMIVVRPVYSLVVKNTVTLTEGNWTTTGAGVYESVDNERALVTISASATDNAGAAFLYWLDAQTGDVASYNRTYSFHAIKDTELTPVYGDASVVTPVPVARISTVKYDSSSKKVNFYAERSIPAEYELIMNGVIVTKTASVGTDEAAFVLDAAGVGKGVSKSTAANGFYTGAVSATAGTTVYARAYVIYQNADGDIITSYSPIASYTV